MRNLSKAIIAVAVSLTCVNVASAQVGNAPYSPGASRTGAGISFAYRQAILNAKILGQRPRALVRGPSGELLTIQRRGRNALVLYPGDGSFIPGARPNAGWPTGLGTGLGWNLASYSGSVGGYRSAPAQSLNSWVSLLPSSADGATSSFGLYSDGGTPIDTWIMQLNQI
tara:strand:- start:5379 stop:5885 length:507 start_codon:yes stop_codon:yes gene_type:complete